MNDPFVWWLFLVFFALALILGVVTGYLWGREKERKEWHELDARERAQRALADIARKATPMPHDWWSAYSNDWGTDPRGGVTQ